MRDISDHEILVIIGANIRVRRKLAGLSQQAVGASIDVSFQQLQKYEGGTNRIPALYLVRLAALFHCTVADFYAGIETPAPPIEIEAVNRKPDFRLLKAIEAIASPKLKQRAIALIEAIGGPVA